MNAYLSKQHETITLILTYEDAGVIANALDFFLENPSGYVSPESDEAVEARYMEREIRKLLEQAKEGT